MFDFSVDPFEHLRLEIDKAVKAGALEATAMQLATLDSQKNPQVRTVLFKGLIRGGLCFYTNYESPKAKQLAENPQAALNFFWPETKVQIRLTGNTDRLTRAESEKYFSGRPRISQVGAWASRQSEPIENSDILIKKVSEVEKQFHNQEVPCPPHWGGFRLVPNSFEFWFGRDGRLHERYVFERKSSESQWIHFQRSP